MTDFRTMKKHEKTAIFYHNITLYLQKEFSQKSSFGGADEA